MNHPKYPIEAKNEQHWYEFFSEGPMGRIRKVVLYEELGDDFFNLAFGDWNEELQQIDDSSRSNNDDRNKVLATVAFTALDFYQSISKCPNSCSRKHALKNSTLSNGDSR